MPLKIYNGAERYGRKLLHLITSITETNVSGKITGVMFPRILHFQIYTFRIDVSAR